MNKEEIQSKLSEHYDEFTVETLSNTIIEFQELFKEKYLTTDKVVEIVCMNIPKGIILYDDIEGKFDATCSITEGEFKVSKNILKETEYFKYTFFHEFIHAISFRKHNSMQFMGFYTIEKGEDYEFKSRAFNEAFTEFIALKRNKLYNYLPESLSFSAYDVGATELELLTKIIPEEELIDCYFNSSDLLDDILQKYNMNMDEIFYSFHVLEEAEYDIKALEERKALDRPQNIFRIIDGERFLYYNLLDHFGEVQNKEEFDKKWSILLSETNSKYNFYPIDGIFRYGQLCSDIDRLGIESDLVPKETLDKYRFLSSIFESEDKLKILEELYKIYTDNYHKYWDLVKDDFAVLAYTFLDKVKNNYQLYDIEIYPRVYKYLKEENAQLEDVDYEKLRCEEEKISFFVFNINNNIYIESNYDDTTVTRINENEFEVKYADQRGILNIANDTYEINGNSFHVKRVY